MTDPTPRVHFTIERTWIQPGDGTRLRWSAQGVKAVYFHPEDQPWQDHEVAAVGEERVCPGRTTTYCLRVVKDDGSAQVLKRVVQVRARPLIELFAVDEGEIRPGECVTFSWRVEGAKEVYLHPEDQPWQGHSVAGMGESQACPTGTTTFYLRAIKDDGSVEVKRLTVKVRGEGPA
jgi:hypothetical protein